MFNFGWGELVVIGIVALIAIGPKELPTVLRTIGQLLGKVRRMANEFQGQFQEALREADIADLKKQAEEMSSSLNSSVSDITNFDPMADTQKELDKSLDMTDSAGSPSNTAADYAPAAPTQVADATSAPAELPPPLPEIDVPLPEPLPLLTEKDFAVEPAAPKETPKQAGSKA